MKLELHILQNFAPSNLNRDDTGSPKDCELGGVRRARVSSQCWKRAIRDAFAVHDLIPESDRAARTKLLVEQVAALVCAKKTEVDEATARSAVRRALHAVELKTDESNDKTEYLVFLPKRSLAALAALVAEHLEELGTQGESDLAPAPAPEAATAPKRGGGPRKAGKKAARKGGGAEGEIDPALRKAIEEILEDGAHTPELALFGRMIANAPGWNVEAACQVAHALSTNRVSMEFDFYTAIDDFKKDDTSGADMMGTIAFNSACFYRYLLVDTAALEKNLGGEATAAREQAKRTVDAFIRAAVLAIPTGKQNSMAAQNPASFVLCDVRDGGAPRSLANAFVEPVRPGRDGDLVSQSVARLAKYAGALDDVYGAKHHKGLAYFVVDPEGELQKGIGAALPRAKHSASLDTLVQQAVAAAFPETP